MRVYPVVHVTSIGQAVEQSRIATDLGSDGVFLIGHSTGTEEVIRAFAETTTALPDAWIGMNVLASPSGFAAISTLLAHVENSHIPRLPDGLWVDDARPDLELMGQLRGSEPRVRAVRYYGGISFKYTSDYSDDPDQAAESARTLGPYVDVVTTSGPGTGKPAPVAKLHPMKRAIGAQPLGLASGATVDNLAELAGVVDDVLVASSVETSPYSGVFDADTLRTFIDAAHRAASA